MTHPKILTLAVFTLLLSACSRGGTEFTTPLERMLPLYVDGLNGNDQNPGTAEAPFGTITRALEVVKEGGTINVAPCVYDEAHGETFPLRIPARVHLIGDPANRGTENLLFPTYIMGAGDAELEYPAGGTAILPEEGVHIEGFGISGSAMAGAKSGIGIRITRDSVVVSKCTIEDCGVGVAYDAHPVTGLPPQRGTLSGNTIRNNSPDGVAFMPGVGAVVVSANWIHHNAYGVWILGANPDLGGGTADGPGSNAFACNMRHLVITGGYDNTPPLTIYARSNYWDELPLVFDPVGYGQHAHITINPPDEVLLDPTFQGDPCP